MQLLNNVICWLLHKCFKWKTNVHYSQAVRRRGNKEEEREKKQGKMQVSQKNRSRMSFPLRCSVKSYIIVPRQEGKKGHDLFSFIRTIWVAAVSAFSSDLLSFFLTQSLPPSLIFLLCIHKEKTFFFITTIKCCSNLNSMLKTTTAKTQLKLARNWAMLQGTLDMLQSFTWPKTTSLSTMTWVASINVHESVSAWCSLKVESATTKCNREMNRYPGTTAIHYNAREGH